MCSEAGENVPFGEDAYYEQIVAKDFRDYDFQKQREAWREGTDFSFKAEFFAEADEAPAAEETVVDTEAKVVDVEVEAGVKN
jgi:hypothetical protein